MPSGAADLHEDANSSGSFELAGGSRSLLFLLGILLVAAAYVLPSPTHAGAAEARHFEKVSPDDKSGGDIVGDSLTTIAAENGDAVAFNARTLFAGAVGSGVAGQTDYVARRSEDGAWTTNAVTPMPRPDAVQIFFTKTRTDVFSRDLNTAFISGYDLPGATGGTPERNNLYLADTETGALETLAVTQQDPLSSTDFISGTEIWGLSDDARHVSFQTATKLLPGLPNGQKVYQWDEGALSLASVRPNGTPAAGDIFPKNYREAMSSDGSRLAFRSPANASGQLYLRIDGESTHWVSQPEGSDQSMPTGVRLQSMTPDGRTVFFISNSPLLDEDTNSEPDLYRYVDSDDPEADSNLTLITGDGGFGGADGGVIGSSVGGDLVYYITNADKLMLWEDGDRTEISSSVADPVEKVAMLATAMQPGNARVSLDGAYLVLLSSATLTGEVTNGTVQMYLYDQADEQLMCVSCPAAGASSDVTVVPETTSGLTLRKLEIRPNFLSDDGEVFFSSDEALVPGDVNGVMDVYEYDAEDGGLSLLSTGKGSEPAMFADASRDGDDVFIVTAQQLTADDDDQLVDLYDVRTGGAPASSAPVPPLVCEEDECQGAPTSGPQRPGVGSTATGAGNASQGDPKRFRVVRPGPVSGNRVALRVEVAAAGLLSIRGGVVRSVRRAVPGPGIYRVGVVLKPRARGRLAMGRQLKVKTTVRFRPDTGEAVKRNVRLLFRPAKGSRR